MKEKLRKIGDIAGFINRSSSLEESLQLITSGLCQHSVWTTSGVMAVDEAAGVARVLAYHDPYFNRGADRVLEWSLKLSPTPEIVRSGDLLILPNVQEQTTYPNYRKDAIARSYKTAVILPLKLNDSNGCPLVLSAHAREQVDVGEEETIFLETVAGFAAIAIEKNRQIEHENSARLRVEAIVETHAQLMQQALSNGDLAVIFEQLATLFSFPVFVYDANSAQMLARAGDLPEQITRDDWCDYVRNSLASTMAESVKGWSDDRASNMGKLIVPEKWIDWLDLDEAPFHKFALEADGEVIGILGIFAEQDAFDEIDQVAIQMARLVLGVVLLRRHLQLKTEIDSRSAIYEQLFAQDWRNDDLLKARGVRLGLHLDQPARLLLIRPQKKDLLNEGGNVVLLHSLDRAAEKIVQDRVILQLEDDFLLIFKEDEQQIQAWEREQGQFLKAVSWILQHTPIVALSRSCKDLQDYAGELDHCRRVARLASAFNLDGLVCDKDLGSLSLLLSIADNSIVQDYLASSVMPLVQHDLAHDSDLLESLKLFVAHEGSYKACAEELGIHVSTLRYRLERIRDLFGIDATDRAARFDLQLALRLLDMRGLG